jgi:hypothetical protein
LRSIFGFLSSAIVQLATLRVPAPACQRDVDVTGLFVAGHHSLSSAFVSFLTQRGGLQDLWR